MTTAHPIHLCIGAPRAGTTWLFKELSRHPQIFLPCVKEVRYWIGRRTDAMVAPQITNATAFIAKLTDPVEIADQTAWLDRWRPIACDAPPDPDEYLRLMTVPGRPSLDISPVYSTAPPQLIRQIRDTLPAGSKVIYHIREPLARLESQMKLHFHMQGLYRGPAHDQAINDFVADPLVQHRWDYARVISDWRPVFGDDLIVVDYDRIMADPKAFTLQLADRLGLDLPPDIADQPDALFSHADTNHNQKGFFPRATDSARAIMARALLDSTQRLADIQPNPAQGWLGNLRDRAGTPAPQPLPDPIQRLMRLSEALGTDGAFGRWQQANDYDTESLLRDALAPTKALLDLCRHPLPPSPQDAALPDMPDRVRDAQFAILWPAALAQDRPRLLMLYRKWVAQLQRRPGLYVLTDNDATPAQARQLLDYLRAHNPGHRLLWVIHGSGQPAISLGGGLYLGQRTSDADWTAIMDALTRDPDIAHTLHRMLG